MLDKLEERLEKERNPEKAKLLQGFFKTGKGEYGEGDVFLGITVPRQREIAKEFYALDMRDIQTLLDSEIHEKRMIALIVLMHQYKRANENRKKEIYEFYMGNVKRSRINNWDLVDLSCCKIVGEFLLNKDRDILYKLAKGSLWERRVAIISTFVFIKKIRSRADFQDAQKSKSEKISDIREKDFSDTIKISEILLEDKHDLIHKAVGWMLREIGKRDEKVLIEFLNKHYKRMPRTMLRYAIEKLDEKRRKSYLLGDKK